MPLIDASAVDYANNRQHAPSQMDGMGSCGGVSLSWELLKQELDRVNFVL
jgi:hypothetical protein